MCQALGDCLLRLAVACALQLSVGCHKYAIRHCHNGSALYHYQRVTSLYYTFIKTRNQWLCLLSAHRTRTRQDYFELGVILLRKKLFTQATKNLEKAKKTWNGEPEELAQVWSAQTPLPV